MMNKPRKESTTRDFHEAMLAAMLPDERRRHNEMERSLLSLELRSQATEPTTSVESKGMSG